MSLLPPKKRKENRRSQEELHSSDETSSCTSDSTPTQMETESVSPISTSPTRPTSPPPAPSLIPLAHPLPLPRSPDSIAESPPLNRRIKDEPEDEIMVDDTNRSSEADSGVEDIKTEDDHSGHSDEDNGIRNLERNLPDHPQPFSITHPLMMALHQANQARVCRPIANRVGTLPLLLPPSLFLPPPFGFPPYPRVLLPQPPSLPAHLPPSSPPPLAPNRPFSPRMRKLSPHAGNRITDGNSPTGRMTRIDDSHFESDLGKKQKDEKLAANLGLPKSDLPKVIAMPMDEFQDYAHQKSFSEDQLNILRDIRRRGKNKVAAQNCRKRKIDQIEELQGKVEDMKDQIKINEKENQMGTEELFRMKDAFLQMKEEIEKNKQDFVMCSQHANFTKDCLGTKGCDITVKTTSTRLIRS